MPVKPVVEFLYTNIGRGHPFYLDGITDALIHSGQVKLVRQQKDVFEISRGLSLVGWKLARWFYQVVDHPQHLPPGARAQLAALATQSSLCMGDSDLV